MLIHLVCDFPLQNHWLAKNKADPLHPAGYIHAAIHGVAFLLIFPVWAAAAVAVAHFLIDLRKPLEWWGKLVRQTSPEIGLQKIYPLNANPRDLEGLGVYGVTPCFGMGLLVRVWTDQTFHLAVVGGLALLAY